MEAVKNIVVSDIHIDEANFGINLGFNQVTERIFDVEEIQSRIRYYDNNFVNSIVYEMSSQLLTVSRIEYGLFTFFSDVGGLFGITFTLGTVLTLIFTLDGPHSFVAADMLKTQDKHGSVRAMATSVQTNCCLLIRLKIAGLCCLSVCTSRGKHDRKILYARKRMKDQFKIADFIKLVHVMHSILRDQISDHVWHQKYLIYSAGLQAKVGDDNDVFDPMPETSWWEKRRK